MTVLEGSRMAISSRIMRVNQSSLLEDDVNHLASVQTGSLIRCQKSRYKEGLEDDVQLHLISFFI